MLSMYVGTIKDINTYLGCNYFHSKINPIEVTVIMSFNNENVYLERRPFKQKKY